MTELSVLETVIGLASRGGWVLIPIFCIGWYAWYLTVERYFFYRSLKRSPVRKFWKILKEQGDEAAAMYLKKKHKGYFTRLAEAALLQRASGPKAVEHALEAVRHDVGIELSKSMRSISVAASVAPLLGLLGTVSGMVHTFEIIEMFGFGNPVLLADGISEALLTTQAGLLVAFPLMLAYNYLSTRIDNLEDSVWKEALKLTSEI